MTTASGWRDLVLVGGGHSHVEVLRQFAKEPAADIRLTLVSRDMETPYSGMLPGFIAGHYTFEDCHIDLRPLARAAGARLYHAEVVSIDPEARLLRCEGRPSVAFTVVSFDIGSRPGWDGVPGAAEHVIPIKPVDRFLAGLQHVEAAVAAGRRVRIVVVGGGAGGTELCMALRHRFRTRHAKGAIDYAIVTDTDTLLPAHAAPVQRRVMRAVRERGIAVHLNQAVVRVTSGKLHCASGGDIAFDAALWATTASAPPWVRSNGLATDGRGFIAVDDTLRSISHPDVFASGDVAAMIGRPLAKSGVYAVRQGPTLARNLRSACRGEALESYRPQRQVLSLISTGDRHAILSRGRFSTEGAMMWRVKDHIDRRWMAMYQNPAAMAGARSVPRDGPAMEMRCGGCGAKIGSEILRRALVSVQPSVRDDVVIGLNAADDAAVLAIAPGKLLVQSVDFFRSFLDDPYLFGRIAANHCLSDLYAMGAAPQTALAIVTLPHGDPAIVESDLMQLLSGIVETLAEAGAILVGGHTGEGADLACGLTVNGLADGNRLLRKSGVRIGDGFILTKPLGTGAIFAGDMRGKAKGRWIDEALSSMLRSNKAAIDVLQRHGASACTDVTGFGLIGHLFEMLDASMVDATLMLSSIPALDGALELLGQGITSSLAPQNLARSDSVDRGPLNRDDPRLALLYDPQTAGGLLASVSAENVERCVAELRARAVEDAACIGRASTRAGSGARITIK